MLSLSLRVGAFPSMLLLLMGTMDCITTVIGIMYFGAVECNPLMSGIISTNITAFVVLKLTTTVFVFLIFVQAKKILNKSQNKTSRAFTATQKLLKVALNGVIAFLVVVVSNNLVVLVQAL